MKNLPFDKQGRFWRGNLHTHSTRSDGKLSPMEVCRAYHEAGYHFLSITDHFLVQYDFPLVDASEYQADDFVTLVGAELHTGETELGHLWHILAVGLPLDFAPPAEDESGPEITARALASGAYVAVAHPQWYGLTEADVVALGEGVHAIEVFNGTSVDHNDKADSWYMMDLMLMRGHHYTACATDDAHFHPHRHDFALGWIWVKSESLTPSSILTALKAGHYYSSTGPQIYDVQVESGERIVVRCSPAERIFLTGHGWESVHMHGTGMLNAELSLRSFKSDFCRITVRDSKGGRAWTNPIWLR